MKNFFLGVTLHPGTNFDFAHIVYLVTVFVLTVLIIKYRKRIRKISNNKFLIIKIISSIIIVVNQIIYRFSYIYYGKFNFAAHLDLYFCFIVDYLFVISLFKKDDELYKLVFPLVFMGPLLSIIFPCLTAGFDTYVFYQTIVAHGFLFVINLFVFYYKNQKLKFIDFLRSFVLANGIVFMTYVFNNVFDTKYNVPSNVFKGLFKDKFFLKLINGFGGYVLLELIGIIGCIISSFFNKYFVKDN